MRRYSATEAIRPAWEHTRSLLWQDRNGRQLLKLCLVSLGAELTGSFNLHVSRPGSGGDMSTIHTALLTVGLLLALFGLVIGLVALYFGSRLQLTQFDILVLRDPAVAPAWRRHGQHTWRWIGLKVVLTLGVLLLFSPLLIPAVPLVLRLVHATADRATDAHAFKLQWQAIALLVLEIAAFAAAVVSLIRFATSLALPGLAMEDLRFGDAMRRAWWLFRTDVGAMLAYAVLQPILLFLLGLLTAFAWLLTLLVLALPFGLLGGLLWAALHRVGSVGWVVLGTYGAVALLLVLVAWLAAYIVLFGTVMTFSRAWSLYFLGGRYPLLGQYLEPEVAVPVWTPPPTFPPDDAPDDGFGDGPDFPADPALA